MSCDHTRVNGVGSLATCAEPSCAQFIAVDRDAIDAAFDRMRAGLSAEDRQQEAETRARCHGAAPSGSSGIEAE